MGIKTITMKAIMYLLLVAAMCGCRSVKTNRDKSASDIVHSAYVTEKDYTEQLQDSSTAHAAAVSESNDVVIEFNDTSTTDVPVTIEHEGGTITIHAPQRNIRRIQARVKKDSVTATAVATTASYTQQVQRDSIIKDSAHVVKDIKQKESKGLPVTGFMLFLLLFAAVAALVYWKDKGFKA